MTSSIISAVNIFSDCGLGVFFVVASLSDVTGRPTSSVVIIFEFIFVVVIILVRADDVIFSVILSVILSVGAGRSRVTGILVVVLSVVFRSVGGSVFIGVGALAVVVIIFVVVFIVVVGIGVVVVLSVVVDGISVVGSPDL